MKNLLQGKNKFFILTGYKYKEGEYRYNIRFCNEEGGASKIRKSKNVLSDKRIWLIFGTTLIAIAYIYSGNYLKDIGVFSKPVSSEGKLPIYSVKTEKKQVAITFDSTWGEENTEKVLEILDKHNAKATFFLIGSWIKNFEAESKAIHKKGHEIANHSERHKDFAKISREEIIKEIADCDARIVSITGKKSDILRVPSGSYNDEALKIAEELGRYTIQWDADSLDWKKIPEDQQVDRMLEKIKKGSIVLFHVGANNTTLESLDKLLTILGKEGYEFKTVSELIYKKDYSIDINGVQFQK